MAQDQFRQSQSRWGNGHGPLTHGRPNLQAAAASRVGLPHGSGTPPSPPHCRTLSAPTADLTPEPLGFPIQFPSPTTGLSPPTRADGAVGGVDEAEARFMPMTPFVTRFPELGARETRALRVTGRKELPDGEYGFLELFCDEPGCDCRRVMIAVLRADTDLNKIWASINYGWESVEFYKQWGGSWVTAANSKGPFLDPMNPQ